MKFRFLEDMATADVAFEAYGKTLEELFENCGLALMETMVDSSMVTPSRNEKLKMKNEKLESLLFDFLSELVFLKDRDSLLFSKINVKINKLAPNRFSLAASLFGDSIDPSHHHLRADVKAVTKHLFKIEKEKGFCKATVVLDI